MQRHLFAAMMSLMWATGFLLTSTGAQAGQVFEVWTRVCFSKDMTTEWLVADDRDWQGYFWPDKTVIYLLVPPTVKQVGDHWEITFDLAGKKKERLAEHFDDSKAYKVRPGGFRGIPRSVVAWGLTPRDMSKPWLFITSKACAEGKNDRPNVQSNDSGILDAFNLDPESALALCFLEPTVTEQDGEWILTTKASPTEEQKSKIARSYADWQRDHPGPKSPKAPTLRYPPKMQQAYDDYWKKLREWQKTHIGTCPILEESFQLTPEQKKQYEKWQSARSAWLITGGEGPFPQPIDFITE